MQIVDNIIVTSVEELEAIKRFLICHNIEAGQVNLNPKGDDVYISQPENIPMMEGVEVRPTIKVISLMLK
jgi:hypothetical protein